MPVSLLSSPFPYIHHSDGLTCLHLHRRRAQSNSSRLKQHLHTILDAVNFRDRRSSDLGRDDLGCFCAPRPEEWWWNSEAMRCKEEKAERQGLWDGFVCDPLTVSQGEEAPTTEEDVGEVERKKLVPMTPLRRRGNSDAHITMRYQERLDILDWRQDLPNLSTTQSLVASAPARTECEPMCRNNCFSKQSSEATATRIGSRASSASSVTLNTQEEQVFFDKVRKELLAAQRSIDDEVLRCVDRLQEHCACITCDKWRALKCRSKEQADREDGWKTSLKSMLKSKVSITEARAARYGTDAWS